MNKRTSSLSVRIAITTALAAAVAVMSACIDTSQGVAGSGAVGSIGSECTCPQGSADCDGQDGQCSSGLACRRVDNGQQICTHDCGTGLLGCPTNFVCKALGIVGGRLNCTPKT